jgi:hypothetical protein
MFRPSGPILPAPLPKREDIGVGSEAWEREKRRRNLLRRRPSLGGFLNPKSVTPNLEPKSPNTTDNKSLKFDTTPIP